MTTTESKRFTGVRVVITTETSFDNVLDRLRGYEIDIPLIPPRRAAFSKSSHCFPLRTFKAAPDIDDGDLLPGVLK